MVLPLLTLGIGLLGLYLTHTCLHLYLQRQTYQRLQSKYDCLPAQVKIYYRPFPFSLLQLVTIKRAIDKQLYINCFWDLYVRYGATRVYGSIFGGGKIVVVTAEPENLKTFLATSFHDFDLGEARHEAFSLLLGDGIFTTSGRKWEHARALLRPQFTKDQIADLEDLEVHFGNLVRVLEIHDGGVVGGMDGKGGVVALHKLFLNLTLDSSTSFLFGTSVFSLLNNLPPSTISPTPTTASSGVILTREQSRQFEDDFDYCQSALGLRLAIWDFRWLYQPSRLPQAVVNIHRTVNTYIDRAIRDNRSKKDSASTSTGKYVFLEALARDTQDPIVIRDQVLSALLAGRDTTATLLSWTFHLLSKHPRVFHKLRREILHEIGPDKLPTYQQLKDAQYLKHVLTEVLRLFPVIPVNFRTATTDTTLPLGGGPDGKSPLFLPSGSRVIYSVYVLHRRRDIYGDDADEFRPERWAEGVRKGWEYLPFNGGPRICIGQQLALITASYIVVRMLQRYSDVLDADPDAEGPLKTNLSLSLSPADGARVRLVRDG